MSVSERIAKLTNIRTAIRTALTAKGVSGANSHNYSDFAEDIESIQTGGGGQEYLDAINRVFPINENNEYHIPEGITTIPAYFYEREFSSATGLKVIFPESVKTIETRGLSNNFKAGYAGEFVLNDGIETVGELGISDCYQATFNYFPTKIKSIGKEGFTGNGRSGGGFFCDLKMPKIETIGSSAFSGAILNKENPKIYIGDSCTSISSNALKFGRDPSVTIYIAKPEDSISGSPWGATNATIVWYWDGVTYYDD